MADRRRAGGLLWCAVGLFVALCQGGCGRPASIPAIWSRSQTGHVYTARLLSEHPLYPQYQRLEQEIRALRRSPVVSQTPALFIPLGEWFLPPPDPPAFPLEAFGERVRTWRLTLLPDRPLVQPELDPDLTAEVAWAQSQARQAADSQLAGVITQQENWLAEVRAEAVRARQEALNNVGLDLTIPERDVEAASDRERQRLWAAMEEELKASRAKADGEVTAARQAINQKFEDDSAVAEADARRRMASRAEMIAKSGSEMRSRMSKAMISPEPFPPAPGLHWRPKVGASAQDGSPRPSAGPEARDRQVRLAQANALAGKRAEIAIQMETGTERAIRRLAGLRGARVSFPPAEPISGADMTDELRSALHSMFQH